MSTVSYSSHHTLSAQQFAYAFVSLALISGIVCIMALRYNNLRMVELTKALHTADEQNGDVEGALRALRQHVYTHMNTDLTSGPNAVYPPIQLQYTYERLVRQQLTETNAGNATLYTEAQQYCEKAIPQGVSGSNRLGCIQSYIKQHGPADTPVPAVPKNLYQFDFVSPAWSPDTAGWSMVVTAVSLLTAAGLWLYQSWLRHLLRR